MGDTKERRMKWYIWFIEGACLTGKIEGRKKGDDSRVSDCFLERIKINFTLNQITFKFRKRKS